MLEESLRHGHGYVTKLDAHAQLSEAIKAVRNGKQFVSRGVTRERKN
jgi:hypothetical protein